jgi:hypothetical protein
MCSFVDIAQVTPSAGLWRSEGDQVYMVSLGSRFRLAAAWFFDNGSVTCLV